MRISCSSASYIDDVLLDAQSTQTGSNVLYQLANRRKLRYLLKGVAESRRIRLPLRPPPGFERVAQDAANIGLGFRR
jgi:hypothetical protein